MAETINAKFILILLVVFGVWRFFIAVYAASDLPDNPDGGTLGDIAAGTIPDAPSPINPLLIFIQIAMVGMALLPLMLELFQTAAAHPIGTSLVAGFLAIVGSLIAAALGAFG